MKWNYQKVPVALRTDAEPSPGHLTMLEFDEQGRHHYSVPAANGTHATNQNMSELGPRTQAGTNTNYV
jgi:hypothetical protein